MDPPVSFSSEELRDVPEFRNLAGLTPYLSITVLRCVGDDPGSAFDALVRFVRRLAHDVGRAVAINVRAEIMLSAHDVVDDLGALQDLGLDNLYGLTREVRRVPSWADVDSGLVDVANELVMVVRRGNLFAICGPVPSDAQLKKWIYRDAAPFRFLPQDVLAGTFRGDGKMVWLHGVHRRRASKADNKALGGIRIQDALHPIEDSSFALSAAKIDFQPDDEAFLLRDRLTVSPDRSRISWKRTSYLGMFLAATVEALDLLDKSLVDPDEPDPLFTGLATNEKDLSRVRGAFDIVVTDPDILRGDPDADETHVASAELLLDALLEVRGDQDAAVAWVDVGYDGALAGTLALKPVPVRDGEFDLDVRISGPISHEPALREIRDAIEDADVLTVYYQSGHTFAGRHIRRQRLTSRPFRNIDFEDFSGFEVAREKPLPKPNLSLHEAIGLDGDDSLFGWVVHRFNKDWLLCDDGAGEVADFLHLDNDGTLRVIHVKAAGSHSLHRRIAVTRFEQVVSQAEKNVTFLDNDMLVDHLNTARTMASAAWHDGQRVLATEFVDQLATRLRSDKTFVVIVQPHLLRDVYERARAAIDNGQPNSDSYSLMLLDDLLHSTRRTITGQCDDLTVIGCA